jgi:hypothetical protein
MFIHLGWPVYVAIYVLVSFVWLAFIAWVLSE